MGLFQDTYGNQNFDVYQGSSVPVVPTTFPNENNFTIPDYAKITRDPSDLSDGSTPSARDRLKEIGISFARGSAQVAYAYLQSKAENVAARPVPQTGSPVTPSAPEPTAIDRITNQSGLGKAQLIFLAVVGVLLLVGITKG